MRPARTILIMQLSNSRLSTFAIMDNFFIFLQILLLLWQFPSLVTKTGPATI